MKKILITSFLITFLLITADAGFRPDATIDHDALLNFTSTEHFTEGSIDHTAITNIGTNTHAQLDSFLALLTTKGDLMGYGTSTGRLAVGTDTQVLTADSTQPLGIKWAAAAGGSSGPTDPTSTSNWQYTLDDFEGGLDSGTNFGPLGWDCSPAGGSSSCTHTTPASGEENRKGIWIMTHTNGAGNRVSLYNGQVYKFGDGEHRTGASVKLANVPDATNDYLWNFGYNNFSGTLGAFLTLIGIDRTQNTTNYICITDNNSTPTYADSGVAFDTNWHIFEILTNAAGTEVSFYIDGVSVCGSPITTDIPTVALRLFIGSNWVAGASTRNWDLDFVYHALKPGTSRGTTHTWMTND